MVVGVSYDSQEVLREFSKTRGIEFPLLSDEGSRVITALGLLDRDLEAHHAAFGVKTGEHQHGVAYPAVFILDEAGTVIQKRVQENYRAREGARQLLEAATGAAVLTQPAAGPQVTSAHVRVTAFTDSPDYVRWEKTRLHVELEVDEGWHVYGRPIPTGYVPLTVEVEAQDGLAAGPTLYPAPRPFRVQGLDEEFNVSEGTVRVVLPFALNVPPGSGQRTLRISVGWQACSQSECLMPELHRFELTLSEAVSS